MNLPSFGWITENSARVMHACIPALPSEWRKTWIYMRSLEFRINISKGQFFRPFLFQLLRLSSVKPVTTYTVLYINATMPKCVYSRGHVPKGISWDLWPDDRHDSPTQPSPLSRPPFCNIIIIFFILDHFIGNSLLGHRYKFVYNNNCGSTILSIPCGWSPR